MEQAVWLYVGIISALIGLGFVMTIVTTGQETNKVQTIENTLRLVKQTCDYVCAAEPETMHSTQVQLVSGMLFYASGKAICADFKGEKNCKQCECEVIARSGEQFSMDFSSEEAMQLFNIHSYTCYLERTNNGVAIECKG